MRDGWFREPDPYDLPKEERKVKEDVFPEDEVLLPKEEPKKPRWPVEQ